MKKRALIKWLSGNSNQGKLIATVSHSTEPETKIKNKKKYNKMKNYLSSSKYLVYDICRVKESVAHGRVNLNPSPRSVFLSPNPNQSFSSKTHLNQ